MKNGDLQAAGTTQRFRGARAPWLLVLRSTPVPETGWLARLWNHLTPLRLADTFVALFGALIGAWLSGVAIEGSIAIWPVVISVSLLSGASMIFNDWKDYPIDRINKPERAIASHRVDRRVALLVSLALFVLALALAFLAHPVVGLGAAAITLLSIGYSVGLKGVPLLGNAAVGVAGASPLWIWLPFSTDPSLLYLALIVSLALVNTGREIARTADDVVGDRAHGVRTVASSFGAGASALSCTALTVLALGIAWWPLHAGGVAWPYVVAITLSSLVVAAGLFQCVFLTHELCARRWADICRIITLTMAVGCAAALLA